MCLWCLTHRSCRDGLCTANLARQLVSRTGATEWDLALSHVRSAVLRLLPAGASTLVYGRGDDRPVGDDFAAVSFMVRAVWGGDLGTCVVCGAVALTPKVWCLHRAT